MTSNRKVFFLALILSLLTTSQLALSSTLEQKHVLVLNSFNPGYSWTDKMLQGIGDTFAKSGLNIDSPVHFMDMKRVKRSDDYFMNLKQMLKSAYRDIRFDAVLACDNDALDFIRIYRDELFPGVPVVFSSINDFDSKMLDGRSDITGTSENTDYLGTIKVALALRPATKAILVVTDNTTTGKAHRSAIEKIRNAVPNSVAIRFLSFGEMTLDELGQHLSLLKNDTIVLLVQHFIDKTGASHSLQNSTPIITSRSAVPVFVLTDSRVGLGAIGGDVVSGYHHGEAAADMVVEILKGKSIASIPVMLASPNKFIFDHKVMERFNIKSGKLPPGSIIINRPLSILESYRTELFSIIAAFIVLCGVLLYLLLEIRKRKQIETSLRLTRISVDTASDALFWITPDARIVDVNEAACRSLGYTREELLQLAVPDLDCQYDALLWPQHFVDLKKYGSITFESEHRTRDGRVFPVEIVANYIRDGKEERDCAFVRDITRRKRAEMLQSRSERNFQSIIEVSPIPLAINDDQGNITYLNNAFLQIIGYTTNDIPTVEEWWPLAYPDEEYREQVTGRWLENMEQAKRTGTPFSPMEIKVSCKDASVHTFICSATSLEENFIGSHLVVFYDITERINAEETLQNTQKRLKLQIERMPIACIVWGKDFEVQSWNPAAEKIFGFTAEEAIGRSAGELIVPEEARIHVNGVWQQLLSGEINHSVNHNICKKGCLILCDWTNTPLTDDNGITFGVISMVQDITERKLAEDERLKLEQQLLHAQKLESLGVLAGGIAHDFNNILMAIIGNADLALMRVNKESPAVENLRRIEQAAARAADLAKQMLAYSGKGKFVIEEIDLNILLDEMLHMLEVSISKKAVLRLNPYKPLPAVEADATQMRQIIMNLVINASEAIGDKSGIIAITTGCMECERRYLKDVWLDENIDEGLYVYLEIADTGCGMDKETLVRVFDPFFTTKFTGRGLGMAAVLGIVRGHKGAIKVYSEPNKGTTFKILFPASGKPFEIITDDTNIDTWRGSGKVLLVDDEETVRAVGKEMLKELGFEVITAEDGRDALEKFKDNEDTSLVILDLTMPHLDGEQCFRELKQLNPDVKVIISSGYNEQEVTQKFVGKGLAGFIQKPYKLSVLKEAIRKI